MFASKIVPLLYVGPTRCFTYKPPEPSKVRWGGEVTQEWVTADCDLDLQLEPQLESNHQAAIMNCVSQKKGTPSVTILLQNYNIVKIIKVWLIFTAPLPLC